MPEHDGGVWLAWTWDHDLTRIAVGDLDGRPGDEIATVVRCNRGGVAWPDSVQIYGPDTALLASVALEDIVDDWNGRAYVFDLVYDSGAIRVRWYTAQHGDCGGCHSLAAQARIELTGTTYAAEDVRTYPEDEVVRTILAAIERGDDRTIDGLSKDAEVADSIRRLLVNVHGDGDLACRGALETYEGNVASGDSPIPGLRFCRVRRDGARPVEIGLSSSNQVGTPGAFGDWTITGVHEG